MRVRNSALLLLAFPIFLGSLSCRDNEEVVIKGAVVQPDPGLGCGWRIRSEDGTTYEIMDLPSAFRSPGLVVVAHLQLRTDLASTCMTGPIAEVIKIERYDQQLLGRRRLGIDDRASPCSWAGVVAREKLGNQLWSRPAVPAAHRHDVMETEA